MRSKVSSLMLMLVLVPGIASATSGPREARGTVVDRDGNPIADAVVVFTPKESASEEPVTAKTNKKGKFYAPNLFSTQGDRFAVAVRTEGMVVVHVRLESRTVNRVLVGDIEEKNLKYGQAVPDIYIRPLGEGIVDLTLAPEAEVAKAAQEEARSQTVAAQAAAAAEGGGSGEGGAPAAPQRDPWDEALSRAADGDLADAVPFFEKAIDKKPDDAERREAFAKVLYQLDRPDEALAQAQRAAEIAPNAVGPRMVMYSAYASREMFDEAKQVLLEARELAPQNIKVLEQLAYVADRQGKPQEAIAAYEQIVALDAEHEEAWAELGDLYAATGQTEKSEQAFEKVGELGAEGAHQVFFNIGALIVNKPQRTDEEMQKAIVAFRKAIELKPDYGEAHKQLAFALLGAGDRAGAKSALLKYVEVAPNASDAAQMKSLADAM